MLCFVFDQVLVILSTVWLAYWAGQSHDAQEKMSNIYIYIGLVIACIIVSLLRSVFSFEVSSSHNFSSSRNAII
jgi:hypothetical protein